MAGEEVGDIFRDGKTYDVQVWSMPAARDSVDDIRNVLVDTPKGPIHLGDVATVTVRPHRTSSSTRTACDAWTSAPM